MSSVYRLLIMHVATINTSKKYVGLFTIVTLIYISKFQLNKIIKIFHFSVVI